MKGWVEGFGVCISVLGGGGGGEGGREVFETTRLLYEG